jgi:hypothetical protein
MVQENDFMELNRKLTHLLKGRTIQSESGDEGHVAITFDDESMLKLRVAGQATISVEAKAEAVHEAGEHFQVDLEEGPSVQVQLADPGSSVALRDKSGAVQYLGLFPRREDSGILLLNRLVSPRWLNDILTWHRHS